MREKYTDNIAWLFLKDRSDNDLEYLEIGQPFYCNREIKSRNSLNPMTGMHMGSADEILKTTTQLSFSEHDRVAFTEQPTDDQYSMILKIDEKPLYGRGNKHRGSRQNEYWITIS